MPWGIAAVHRLCTCVPQEKAPSVRLTAGHLQSPQVRDQRVRLYEHSSQGLMVQVLSKARTHELGREHHEAVQFVVDLCMADWQAMRKAVPPGQCLMRNRTGRRQ